MSSGETVYFIDSRVKGKVGLLQRFRKMAGRMVPRVVSADDLVAIKVHFGDDGTTSYLRHIYARVVVDLVREHGGKPFLTDTCTLYRGARSNAVDHLEVAFRNGYSYSAVGAPLIIADGLSSRDVVEVPMQGRHFSTVKYGSVVHHADALICLSRVKGHLACGFGGTIKNLAMGLGSRSQKQAMHASVRPRFQDEELCSGCGSCVEICPAGAVSISGNRAQFDHEDCVGCGECIAICDTGALEILWNESPDVLQEKMVETAEPILALKSGKLAFFDFLLDITPDCDCWTFSDNPIVENIGILASFDPVAIDQAAVDLINQRPGLPGSRLGTAMEPGTDKFRALFPRVDWRRQLVYGEERGVGSTRYELVELDP